MATTLAWFIDSQHVNKLKKNYFPIHVLILSARVRKEELEHDKNDYRKALSYYTEGIELKCKDEKENKRQTFYCFTTERRRLTGQNFFDSTL